MNVKSEMKMKIGTVALEPRAYELAAREAARVHEATGIGTSLKRVVSTLVIERLGAKESGGEGV